MALLTKGTMSSFLIYFDNVKVSYETQQNQTDSFYLCCLCDFCKSFPLFHFSSLWDFPILSFPFLRHMNLYHDSSLMFTFQL